MSWTDDEIDELAKAAHAEQKFAYQDSFWSEVEAMLPQKKKRIWPFFLLGATPILLAIGYFTLTSQPEMTLDFVAKTMPVQSNQSVIQENSIRPLAVTVNNFTPTSEFQIMESSPKTAGISKVNRRSEFINSSQGNKMNRNAIALASGNPEMQTNNLSSRNLAEISLLGEISESNTSENYMDGDKGSELGSDLDERSSNPLSSESLEINSELNPRELSTFEINRPNLLTPLAPRLPRNFWNLYAEAGFAMGQAFVTNQAGHTSSFQAGMGARYNFKNYFLQLGVAAEMQNVQVNWSERAKIYHTSSTIFENSYSYRQLYRLELPLTLGFQLKNHVFQANLSPSYLMGTKLKFRSSMDSQIQRDEIVYGENVCWNNFSMGAGIGYGYQIMKTWTIGANLEWQMLNQLKKDIVKNGNATPFSGQLFLRKTF